MRLSHPTIGRHIRALEDATSQTLFQHTTDGFILTDEGSNILSLVERMEESALAMERRLAGEGQKLKGTLRISSAADWFGAYVLPPAVADCGRIYPRVKIEILTGTRLFKLAQREADIAFRIVSFAAPDIVQRRLMAIPYAVNVAVDAPDPVAGIRARRSRWRTQSRLQG